MKWFHFLSALFLSSSYLSALPNIAPFYQQASEIKPAGKLGEIVKIEPIRSGVAQSEAWKIAYISSDVNNKKTIATALVVAPSEKGHDRPIIAWGHGTTGTAQNTGPSQQENPAVPLNEYFLIGGNSWIDYGLPALEKFIEAGYVIVATDYQGLGGGGRHQYSVAITNGRDILNSIRAVSSKKLGGAGNTALAIGWSQGGGAILSLASDQAYIQEKGSASDDILFKGFVSLAPYDIAAEIGDQIIDQDSADKIMKDLADKFTLDPLNFIHFTMVMWGTQAAFQEELKLSDIFTEKGSEIINEILNNKGVHAASDTIKFNFGDNYRSLLKPKAENTIAWVNAFKKSSVPPSIPVAPLIIYYGTKDVVSPIIMGKLYQEEMCKKGAQIQRVQLSGEQSHFTTPGASENLYVEWIKERLANKPLSDSCIIP